MSRWRNPKFLTRYFRNYQRKRRMRNVRAGRCYCGGERDGDLTHCRKCLDYNKAGRERAKLGGFCLDCLATGGHRDGCIQLRLPVDR